MTVSEVLDLWQAIGCIVAPVGMLKTGDLFPARGAMCCVGRPITESEYAARVAAVIPDYVLPLRADAEFFEASFD
jgi:hypothetical protein